MRIGREGHRDASGSRPVFPQQWIPPTSWEPEIRRFEEQDRRAPPQKGGVVLAGSSTFTLWESAAQDLPNLNVVNRGFGGSVLADTLFYVDRLVTKHAPSAVFVYAGENDLEQGTPPADVAKHFRQLEQAIHRRLPGCHVTFISIKPSPRAAGYRLLPLQRATNTLVKKYAQEAKNTSFLDITSFAYGPDRAPLSSLFHADGWHFNGEGYRKLASAISQHLAAVGKGAC